MSELLQWNIYEIKSNKPLNGVMLRGRIRKLGIKNSFNVLAENIPRSGCLAHQNISTGRSKTQRQEDTMLQKRL